MNKINKYMTTGLLTLLAFLSQSCQKKMIQLNTDPTTLSNIQPEYLFAGVTADMDFTTRQQMINRYTFMQYMQYITPDASTATSLSSAYWTPDATKGPSPAVSYYNDYFTGMGVGLNRIITQINLMADPQKSNYADLKAICQILNIYNAWRVVDIFGAMPFEQAFQSATYPLPAYEGDFDLYKSFDSSLKVAATVLNADQTNQVALGNQDFFYGGNIASWEAFANTLRIKIAMRYENRDKANLTNVMNDIATNFGSKIISSNTQSFGVNNTQGWNNNLDDINALIVNYDAGYAFVEFLKSTNDPRLALLVRQNDWGVNSTTYNTIQANGTPAAKQTLDSAAINTSRYFGKHAFQNSIDPIYGWTGANRAHSFNITTQTQPVTLQFLSFIQSRYFLKNGGFGGVGVSQAGLVPHTDETIASDPSTIKMRTLFLSYAETCFMMAELAQKGYNSLGQSAASWYNAGVTASFQQYHDVGVSVGVPGASAVTIGDYLTRYPYDGTLARIYSQEWVHLMTEPEEAWAMWKRTGYPQFTDFTQGSPSKIGDGTGIAYLETLKSGTATQIIPRRTAFQLGSSGAQLNITNFNAAVSMMQAKDAAYGADALDTKGRIWWDNLGE